MLEIKTDDYHVWYKEETAVIHCTGSFRLNGTEEYAPIVALFNEVADHKPPVVTLDLTNLQFLNSSGINVLSRFVIAMRQRVDVGLVIKGSNKIAWQGKSLQNLVRLMPSLKLEFVD